MVFLDSEHTSHRIYCSRLLKPSARRLGRVFARSAHDSVCAFGGLLFFKGIKATSRVATRFKDFWSPHPRLESKRRHTPENQMDRDPSHGASVRLHVDPRARGGAH